MVVIMYKYVYIYIYILQMLVGVQCTVFFIFGLIWIVPSNLFCISVRFKIIFIADYFQKNTFSVSLKAVLGVSINSFNEALFAK